MSATQAPLELSLELSRAESAADPYGVEHHPLDLPFVAFEDHELAVGW